MESKTNTEDDAQSVILDQVVIHKGMLHGLIESGGILVGQSGKFGVKGLRQGDFTNLQIVVFNEKPRFKYQKLSKPVLKKVEPKKEEAPKEPEKLKVKEGGDLFDEQLKS